MTELPNHCTVCPAVMSLLKQRALAIGYIEKQGTPESRQTLQQMCLLAEQKEPSLCHPEEE